MCNFCEIHKKEKKLINGKYYCFDCLSVTENDKPIRYENLSALNKMPIELRDFRFTNVFNKESKILKSLLKFIDLNAISKLEFNFFWIKVDDYLDTHKIAACITNERLIRHLTSEYLDLNGMIMREAMTFNESPDISERLKSINECSFHCVTLSEFEFVNKVVVSRFLSFMNGYLKSTMFDGNIVVIVSNLKFKDFMESNNIIKNIFTPYKDLIKEVTIKKGDLQ